MGRAGIPTRRAFAPCQPPTDTGSRAVQPPPSRRQQTSGTSTSSDNSSRRSPTNERRPRRLGSVRRIVFASAATHADRERPAPTHPPLVVVPLNTGASNPAGRRSVPDSRRSRIPDAGCAARVTRMPRHGPRTEDSHGQRPRSPPLGRVSEERPLRPTLTPIGTAGGHRAVAGRHRAFALLGARPCPSAHGAAPARRHARVSSGGSAWGVRSG
jgi:hypothetical protein